jgi:hypothetical protein
MANIVVQSVIDDFMQSQSAEAARAAIGADKVEELGVADPEGVIEAEVGTVGYGTDGSVWFKASGIGNTGWFQVLTDSDLNIRGGSF